MKNLNFDWLTVEFLLYCRSTRLREKTRRDDFEYNGLFLCKYHASCVFIIRVLHDSELQIHHGRSLAYLVYLNAENGVSIIIGIKFSTPIIRNVIFGNAFTHSSAFVITTKFIHKFHSFDTVISCNYGQFRTICSKSQ